MEKDRWDSLMSRYTGLDPNDPLISALITALPEHELRQDIVDVVTGVKGPAAFGYRPWGGMATFHYSRLKPYAETSMAHMMSLKPVVDRWHKVRREAE
jgi:hypothetical protein